MIYFTLPDFYERFEINNFFCKINYQFNYYFKEKIKFLYASGNFPYNYWSGDINRNSGVGAYFKDIEQCYQNSALPLRFNFDNLYLTKEDFSNCFSNQILKMNENGCNVVEIANLDLYDYIKEKYPKYNFIFSKNNFFIIKDDIEKLNFLINSKNFILFKIPERLNDNFAFLKQIENKKSLEIIVNPLCKKECKYYDICFEEEQKNIYNFSEKSVFKGCQKNKNNLIITLEDIKEKYIPLGINKFCFNSFLHLNNDEVFNFYLNYFIKKEYQEAVFKQWIHKK